VVAVSARGGGAGRLASLAAWLGLPLALLIANLVLWSSAGAWWRAAQQQLWLRRLVLDRWVETMLQPFVEQIGLVFLGLFFEALPFLLLGATVSGVLSTRPLIGHRLARWAAQPWGLGVALLGGFVLPVCECGVVPVARRLRRFGTRMPVAIAFLLAAPILNPLVIASTWFAFSQQPGMAVGRFALTLLVASGASLALSHLRLVQASPAELSSEPESTPRGPGWSRQLVDATMHGYEDFIHLARYFVVGTLVAAVLQRVMPPGTLSSFAGGPTLAIVALMGLALVLSVCATVDSFVALTLLAAFPPGAVVAFLVVGPLLGLKSLLLYSSAFPRPVVLTLALVTTALCFLGGMALNLVAGAGV
jgi:uncharacterized membrane protein YraQ (UPF0718 family)